MKPLYCAITPVPREGYIPQTIVCNYIVATEATGRFKVEIRFDTSHKNQSRATLSYMPPLKREFLPLLNLEPDEISCVVAWHGTRGPEHGSWQRSGQIIPMVERSALEIAEFGARITEDEIEGHNSGKR